MPRFRFPLSVEDAYQLIGAYYIAQVEQRGIRCNLDDFIRSRIWQLAENITAETPKAGILLTGKVGNGKTTLMRAFNGAARQLADWHRINPDDFGYNHPADFGLDMFNAKQVVQYALSDTAKYEKAVNAPMLGLDELGEEADEVLQYGNRIRPVVDLIENRYDRQRFTFITSNLDPKEIAEHYGERVADRFREMLCIIPFRDQPSYRR